MAADTGMSIEQIVNTIIAKDNSSPISPWLTNVIETYLTNSQSIDPLTIGKLFSLTNDMLLTYSITTTQSQSKQLCAKIIEALQLNHHLPAYNEPFPVHSKCIALYTVDNQWYPARVLEIAQPGNVYLVEFDGYGNQQQVTAEQIARNETNDSELEHKSDEKHVQTEKAASPTTGISLKDAIKEQSQREAEVDKLIMSDVSVSGNGLKKKNPKYVNTMMELHDVDEDKLAALVLNDEEEKTFAAFLNGTVSEKDDVIELDENDVEKYTVGEGKNKRRINPANDVCCICERVLPLTWHHLIPKCTHNEYMKTHPNSSKLFLNKHGIWICRQCHSAIHGMYNNRELMKKYWRLEMLLESETVQKWIKYVSKQRVTGKHDARARKPNKVFELIKKKDHSLQTKYVQ